MGKKFTKPEYRYDEETSLQSLLAAFLAANQNRRTAMANVIGVRVETVNQWVEGNWTEALRTRYFAKFVEVTGIDLDHLMVIEAKRRIWNGTPSFRGVVTLERLPTRRDVVSEIQRLKALPAYDGGTRFIAWQIPTVSETSLSQWSLGRTKPEGDNLEACLIVLSFGLIETGTRNDLAFRLSIRRICGEGPENCLGLLTFDDLMNAVFTREMKARSATVVAEQIGMNPTTTAALLKWTPESMASFPYATILSLARHHASGLWDTPSLERFDHAVAEFLSKENATYAVSEPVLPKAAAKTIAPAVNPPRLAEVPKTSTTTIENAMRRLIGQLRAQLLQAATDFTDIVGKLPIIPSLEIGETIHNVRWCLTGANVPETGGWDPSDQEIKLIAEAIALVRRALLIVLGLPMPIRRRVVKRLAEELDELFIAFDAAGVEDLTGFAEQISLQRKQANIVRKEGGK